MCNHVYQTAFQVHTLTMHLAYLTCLNSFSLNKNCAKSTNTDIQCNVRHYDVIWDGMWFRMLQCFDSHTVLMQCCSLFFEISWSKFNSKVSWSCRTVCERSQCAVVTVHGHIRVALQLGYTTSRSLRSEDFHFQVINSQSCWNEFACPQKRRSKSFSGLQIAFSRFASGASTPCISMYSFRQVYPGHCERLVGHFGPSLLAKPWAKHHQQDRKGCEVEHHCSTPTSQADDRGFHPAASDLSQCGLGYCGHEVSHVLQCARQVDRESHEPFLHRNRRNDRLCGLERKQCQ